MVREERIVISLTEEEKNQIKEIAKEFHVPLATYCRMKVLSNQTIIVQQNNNSFDRLKTPRQINPQKPKEKKSQIEKAYDKVQKELFQKLQQPKPLNKISKKELKEITKRKEENANLTPEQRKARWLEMAENLQQLKIKNKVGSEA